MTATRRSRAQTKPTPKPTHAATPEQALGDTLKAMFDHVADQPLPDDLLQLVDALERKRLADEPDDD